MSVAQGVLVRIRAWRAEVDGPVIPDAELALVANAGSIRDDAAEAARTPEMAEGGGDEKASASTPPVFVSYASHDTAFANAIVEALERNGVRCWIAPRDVNAGRTLYWRDHSRDRCREGQRADIVEQCDVLAACSERSGALCFQATSDRRCE
jgi:hypothetical protein